MKPGMQRQAAYILPKPTAGNNNLANLQVIFPNQIADSAKVSGHRRQSCGSGLDPELRICIRIQECENGHSHKKTKEKFACVLELASPGAWESLMGVLETSFYKKKDFFCLLYFSAIFIITQLYYLYFRLNSSRCTCKNVSTFTLLINVNKKNPLSDVLCNFCCYVGLRSCHDSLGSHYSHQLGGRPGKLHILMFTQILIIGTSFTRKISTLKANKI